MRVTLSRRAGTDLDEIWKYLAQKSGSQEIADRTIDFILKKLDLLREAPRAGRDRSADIADGLRSFPAGKYLIYYRVQKSEVKIARVLHGKREVHPLFPEE
jgi:toxin ParE1/3/4